ncbi:putative ribosomal RNA processing protein 45, partial [Trypanosoma grayi]|uniref:putative ribosomal RNA processing protein 45 n=1 Tax=Trypanosoma grayi TaxID=71804 RepID=UPI0004F479DC
DPTAAEAAAAASGVVVAVNAEGQVCAVCKSEGCCIGAAELSSCIEIATALAPKLLQQIRAAMAAHDARRQEALKGQFVWAQKRSGVSRAETEEAKRARTEG